MTAEPSKDARALARILAYHGTTLVFDVGANEGQYAGKLRALGYAGRIVSFEPLSAVHERLRATAAGDADWTVAPRLALGAAPGHAVLQISAESDMSSFLPMRPEWAARLSRARPCGEERVPVDRLDRLASQYVRPDDVIHLKIDTQGLDLAVLEGASGLLETITSLQIELAIVPVYENEPNWREAVNRVQTLGYEPVYFIPGYFNRRTARLLSMDGLFVRSAALERSGG